MFVCTAAFAVAACGGSDKGGSDASGGGNTGADASPTPSSGDEIKFGALTAVTGDYAPFTKVGLDAGNIAIDEINAAGGVNGKKVKVVVADTESSAEASVPGFSRLSEVEKVVGLGGLDSDGLLAVLDGVEEKQIPVMCPLCGADSLTDKGGDLVARLSPADAQIGAAAAQFARDSGFTNVAILAQKTEGSLSAVRSFKDPFTQKVGGKICAEVLFDPGKPTYQSEVQKAFGCDPQAVFVTTGTEAGIPILREWARRGYGAKLIMSQDMITPEIAKSTPKLEGNAFGPTGAMDRESEAFKSFAERYKAKTGEDPSDGFWESAWYDQWIVLALAMTSAKSTDGAAVAPKIKEVVNAPGKECFAYADCIKLLGAGEDIDYHGATGSLELNAAGDLAEPGFTNTTPKGGKWVSEGAFNLDPALAGK
jgi:branched-chain amino acid transport system substrate-binding protein